MPAWYSAPMEQKPLPPVFLVLATLVLAGVALAATYLSLHNDQMRMAAVLRQENAQGLTRLEERLTRIDERLQSLESKAAVDPAPALTALSKGQDALQETLRSQSAKIEALEKSVAQLPAPNAARPRGLGKDDDEKDAAAQAIRRLRQAVLSGAPYTAELTAAESLGLSVGGLLPMAAQGVVSEATLRTQLRTLLSGDGDTSPPEDSLAARINARLGSLIHISRQEQVSHGWRELRLLAPDAPLEALMNGVRALPPAERARLDDWATQAQATLAAQRALAALEPGRAP